MSSNVLFLSGFFISSFSLVSSILGNIFSYSLLIFFSVSLVSFLITVSSWSFFIFSATANCSLSLASSISFCLLTLAASIFCSSAIFFCLSTCSSCLAFFTCSSRYLFSFLTNSSKTSLNSFELFSSSISYSFLFLLFLSSFRNS